MIRKILFVLLFFFVASVILADNLIYSLKKRGNGIQKILKESAELDIFTKNISSFKKKTIKLEGKNHVIYHKIFKKEIVNGNNQIFFVLKDEAIKNYRAYLKVKYIIEQKVIIDFGLDENILKKYSIEKIRRERKSVLVNISDEMAEEKILIIIKQIL